MINSSNYQDHSESFRQAMLEAGITCHGEIVADGQIHRFSNSKNPNKKAGWYILFERAGVFGDWKTGRQGKWSQSGKGLSREERKAIAEDVRKARQARDEEVKNIHELIAQLAQKLWEEAKDEGDSEYLCLKQVEAIGVKFSEDEYGKFVAIPLYDIDFKLWNIQKLYPKRPDGKNNKWPIKTGAKQKGCFHVLGVPLHKLASNARVWIAEGYSTSASAAMALNETVIMAINADNIAPVVQAIRSKYPHLDIYIIADDDRWNKEDGTLRPESENKGVTCAKVAAEKYNCSVFIPQFAEEYHYLKPTDVNDMHCMLGLEVVKEQLEEFLAVKEKKKADEIILKKAAEMSELEYDRKKEELAKELGIGVRALNAERRQKQQFKKQTEEQLTEEQREELFKKLSTLPKIDYILARKEAADRLGIKLSDLDKIIKFKKAEDILAAIEEENSMFPQVEPWDTLVAASELLQELTTTFKRFAILPEHADTALALWIIFTYFIEQVGVSPLLAISSPEKQCGKTTVLDVLIRLVCKALPASNISSSCIFRTIELWKPTLIIDEADTFIAESEELRGILNSGHTRPTAFVIRAVGDDHTPTQFSTWGAKAIALIGHLPETLHDRSIVVQLRRKLITEKVEKLRYADGQIFIDLQRKLVRFAQDNVESIKNARPSLPNNISDRAADNWEPLLAIAGLAGEEWLIKANNAALVLSSQDQDANSKGADLLNDIRQVFEEENKLKISSKKLIDLLCKDEEMPWPTWNRGKPLTERQLARLLKPYDIHSKTVRLAEGASKGFEKDQFIDTWKRYLPSKNQNVTDKKVTGNISVTQPDGISTTLEGVCYLVTDNLEISQKKNKNIFSPQSETQNVISIRRVQEDF